MSTIMRQKIDDSFDKLLELEDTFYNEGYDLGVADGKQAGLIEGRFFGLEKGFEKYASIGRLHGKVTIWAGRLSPKQSGVQTNGDLKDTALTDPPEHKSILPALADNLRLEKHVRTLYALVEPGSLSTENTEEAVSDFDDRLKRAEGKVKIIERITAELDLGVSGYLDVFKAAPMIKQRISGDGSIEDASSLQPRH